MKAHDIFCVFFCVYLYNTKLIQETSLIETYKTIK